METDATLVRSAELALLFVGLIQIYFMQDQSGPGSQYAGLI
jgi:hypothetical protein